MSNGHGKLGTDVFWKGKTMNYEDHANDGPWKCRRAGTCGDIFDTRDNQFYGSMLYDHALEIVRQLNQRWRWLKERI